MGIIARTTTFVDGTTAEADEVNTELDTIVDEFNGSIDGDNIDSTATVSIATLSLSGTLTMGSTILSDTDNTDDLGSSSIYWKDLYIKGDLKDASNAFTLTELTSGWIPAEETWTYASDDDPTFTFTISGDKTSKYSAGMRIKLTQTTAKYFIITVVAYSSPNTTVTIYGGTDYNLADAAITLPYYSTMKAPLGFPLNPAKWTAEITDTTLREQGSPTQNTWYNLGSISINIPIGNWNVSYNVCLGSYIGSATATMALCTLSTANNSESDVDFTSFNHFGGASGNLYLRTPAFKSKPLDLTSKTTYYLNTRTTVASMGTIYNVNDCHKLIIRAVCALL